MTNNQQLKTYLSLGSNLGDKEAHIERAIELLNASCGEVISRSSLYETAAWGKSDQPSFYNIALCLRTTLSPSALLDNILKIEIAIGRVREERWGPRLIDIDIIFYGDEVVSGDKLQIPHPEMQNRKFVLLPLEEIAANVVHPVLGKSVSRLLEDLDDPLEVRRM